MEDRMRGHFSKAAHMVHLAATNEDSAEPCMHRPILAFQVGTGPTRAGSDRTRRLHEGRT